MHEKKKKAATIVGMFKACKKVNLNGLQALEAVKHVCLINQLTKEHLAINIHLNCSPLICNKHFLCFKSQPTLKHQ